MKKVLIATLAIGMMAGCEEPTTLTKPSDHDIPLYGIQTNPTQHTWTSSPKAYGQMIIDDTALGCPLEYPEDGGRPFVKWSAVREILVSMKVL